MLSLFRRDGTKCPDAPDQAAAERTDDRQEPPNSPTDDTLLLKAHAQVTIWPTSTTPAWFTMDSLLEGAVTSEPVSEPKIPC
jgi:hypothetical protein